MVYDSSDFTVFYSNQQMLSFFQKFSILKNIFIFSYLEGENTSSVLHKSVIIFNYAYFQIMAALFTFSDME
jgi:hypothetical protein